MDRHSPAILDSRMRSSWSIPADGEGNSGTACPPLALQHSMIASRRQGQAAFGGGCIRLTPTGYGLWLGESWNNLDTRFCRLLTSPPVGFWGQVNGAKVVECKYNEWGLKLTTEGSMAVTLGILNPFRYRGYVYDEEMGLYNLQNRYYDSSWGRFISSDDLIGETGSLLTHNTYTYCWNNPVKISDDDGNWPNCAKVLVGAIATVAAVALTVATGGAALQ